MENNRIPEAAGQRELILLILHGPAGAEGSLMLEIQSVQLPFYLFLYGRAIRIQHGCPYFSTSEAVRAQIRFGTCTFTEYSLFQ